MVKRWLLSVRSLPKLATAEHFLGALGEIATDEQYALLEVERAWREIALDAADSRTLCRLDSALRISKTKTDHNDIASAISRLTEQLPAASQAAWLVKLAAAGDTPPSTRNLIETRFLRKAFVRFIGTDWQHFLDKAGDDLFVYGNILLMVARHLALADPSPNLRSRFEQACIAHDREDALEGVAGAVPQSLKERVVDWYRGAFGS